MVRVLTTLLVFSILTSNALSLPSSRTIPFSVCHPKVLKPVGKTYKIAEKDMLQEILEEAQKVDWRDLNEKMRERIYEYKPKNSFVLLPATEQKVRYYDPTWILPFDIKDAYGNVLYPKGTAINPLEKIPEAVWKKRLYVFFDLQDKVQREFVSYLLKHEGSKKFIMLIADGHSDLKGIHDFTETSGYPTYALTKLMADRFGVRRSFSLVSFVRKDGKPVVKISELPDKYIEEHYLRGKR